MKSRSSKIQRVIRGSTIFISAAVLTSLVLLFFTFGPYTGFSINQNQVKQVYLADNITAVHRKVIDAFNKQYRGRIEVVPINLPFTRFSTNERKEMLLRAFRDKSNRIDIFTVDIIWVPRFAKWSKPLTDYVQQDELDRIFDYGLTSCYFNDELVALPFYIDVGLLFYRKDILETLPDYPQIRTRLRESMSWSDFIALKKRLPGLNNPFYIFAADNYEGLICSFIETMISENQPLFRGNDLGLDTPEAREGLQLLVDLVNRYSLTPDVVTRFDETHCYEYALENDALFLRAWPGLVQQFDYIDQEKVQMLEAAALPHMNGNRPAYVYGGWNFMLSSHSDKTEEALEFIRFILRKENQALFYKEAGYFPLNKEIFQDTLFLEQFPELDYYRKLLQYGFHRPFLENYTKISDVISYYVHQAIKKEITVEEALKRARAVIQADQVVIK